jgi:hypothetical protein
MRRRDSIKVLAESVLAVLPAWVTIVALDHVDGPTIEAITEDTMHRPVPANGQGTKGRIS